VGTGVIVTWLWARVWPGWDAVYPNLVASAISGSVVWLWARRRFRGLHRRHDELHKAVAEAHKKAQAHAEDTNRLVRVLSDRLGIDPDTGEDRLPPPRY
jgi:hypothetical protein